MATYIAPIISPIYNSLDEKAIFTENMINIGKKSDYVFTGMLSLAKKVGNIESLLQTFVDSFLNNEYIYVNNSELFININLKPHAIISWTNLQTFEKKHINGNKILLDY